MKKIFLLLFLYKSAICNSTELIIFSFDRAMQLYALLESIEKYTTGLNKINLIYRCSNNLHELSYNQVLTKFAYLNINPKKQGANPKKDFKHILNQALKKVNTKYVAFAVDDIIITDFIDFKSCTTTMEHAKKIYPKIWGFFLRMGENITHSNIKTKIKQPVLRVFEKDFILWNFSEGSGCWNYPNTVDLAIYKKNEIYNQLNSLDFSSPNTLEGSWAQKYALNKQRLGIAYKHSKMINIPANLIQEDFKAPIINSFSTEDLLLKFQKGLKIDIYEFFKINNNATHSYNLIYKFAKQ